MKTCNHCNLEKPVSEFRKNGKDLKGNAIYRPQCNLCYRKVDSGKRLKSANTEQKERILKYRFIKHEKEVAPSGSKFCPICNSYKNSNLFSSRGSCRECSSLHDIQRNRLFKQKAIEYLGGKCVRCNTPYKHYSVYDFHHRVPSTKEFNWGKARKSTFEKIKKELDKCDLLCKNCHAIVHTKLLDNGELNPEYVSSVYHS